MNTQDETQLDCFLPVGDHFALVVAAIAPAVLVKSAGRMREEHPTCWASRWEEEARNRER